MQIFYRFIWWFQYNFYIILILYIRGQQDHGALRKKSLRKKSQ